MNNVEPTGASPASTPPRAPVAPATSTTSAADQAVAEAAGRPEPPVAAQPVDADWTPERTEPNASDHTVAPPDVGVLESIGRSITAPVRDAAASDAAAQTGEQPRT